MEGPRRTNSWQAVKSRQYNDIVYAKGFKEFYLEHRPIRADQPGQRPGLRNTGGRSSSRPDGAATVDGNNPRS